MVKICNIFRANRRLKVLERQKLLDLLRRVKHLVEKTEAHIIIFFFRLLLGWGSGSSSGSWSFGSNWSSSSSGGGELLGISQEFLECGGFLELDASDCGNSQQVLESVDQRVGSGGQGGVADAQRNACNIAYSLLRK